MLLFTLSLALLNTILIASTFSPMSTDSFSDWSEIYYDPVNGFHYLDL